MKNIKEWFPLYAADWMTSMGLRLCSPFSRGILIDLMAYSWQTGTPGKIADNPHDLALFFHCTEDEFAESIAELEKRGCIEKQNGDILIKRLQEIATEQHRKYIKRAEAGRRGGLAKSESTDINDTDSSNAKAMESNAVPIEEIREDKSRIELPYGDRFAEAWEEWQKHRKEMRKKLTPSTVSKQLKKLERYGSEDTAVAVIERSIENGWTGLFDLDKEAEPSKPSTPTFTKDHIK